MAQAKIVQRSPQYLLNTLAHTLAIQKPEEVLPCYLLQGEERFFAEQMIRHIKKITPKENFIELDAAQADLLPTEVVLAMQHRSFLGGRVVCYVRNVNQFKQSTRKKVPSPLEVLCTALEAPILENTLILDFNTAFSEKRLSAHDAAHFQKMSKLVLAHGVHIASAKLDAQLLLPLLPNLLQLWDIAYTQDALLYLLERIEPDLNALFTEIWRLQQLLGQRADAYTVEEIAPHVAATRKYSVAQFVQALLRADIAQVTALKKDMLLTDTPLELVVSELRDVFQLILQLGHELKQAAKEQRKPNMGMLPPTKQRNAEHYLEATKHFSTRSAFYLLGHLRHTVGRSRGVHGITISKEDALEELIVHVCTAYDR